MKLVEQYGVPTIYVDDFGDHQVINGVLHTVGFREHREDNNEPIGIIEVRLIINLANFRDACIRGIEMTSEMGGPPSAVSVSHH